MFVEKIRKNLKIGNKFFERKMMNKIWEKVGANFYWKKKWGIKVILVERKLKRKNNWRSSPLLPQGEVDDPCGSNVFPKSYLANKNRLS